MNTEVEAAGGFDQDLVLFFYMTWFFRDFPKI